MGNKPAFSEALEGNFSEKALRDLSEGISESTGTEKEAVYKGIHRIAQLGAESFADSTAEMNQYLSEETKISGVLPGTSLIYASVCVMGKHIEDHSIYPELAPNLKQVISNYEDTIQEKQSRPLFGRGKVTVGNLNDARFALIALYQSGEMAEKTRREHDLPRHAELIEILTTIFPAEKTVVATKPQGKPQPRLRRGGEI